jgi:hypothetical protein
MITKDDWRYDLGKNLKGREFVFKQYKPLSEENDHDHCGFCTEKFSQLIDGALKEGYQTILEPFTWNGKDYENDEWVCSECFNDFKDLLDLKIKKS